MRSGAVTALIIRAGLICCGISSWCDRTSVSRVKSVTASHVDNSTSVSTYVSKTAESSIKQHSMVVFFWNPLVDITLISYCSGGVTERLLPLEAERGSTYQMYALPQSLLLAPVWWVKWHKIKLVWSANGTRHAISEKWKFCLCAILLTTNLLVSNSAYSQILKPCSRSVFKTYKNEFRFRNCFRSALQLNH